MDNIEAVKKILKQVRKDAFRTWPPLVDERAIQICQLFEPKPKLQYSPDLDKIPIEQTIANPATNAPKPSVSKVLTIAEIKANPDYNEYLKTMSYGEAQRACQRDLTASIVNQECQQKFKRMKGEIEDWLIRTDVRDRGRTQFSGFIESIWKEEGIE